MTDHQTGAVHEESARLLHRLKTLQVVRATGPAAPNAGASDAELARQLVIDTLTVLTRTEITLQASTEAVIAHTRELQRANDLRAAEVDLARQQFRDAEKARALEQQSRVRWQDAAAKFAGGVAAWGGAVAFDGRVLTAVITAITSIVGTLAALWGGDAYFGSP